MYLDNVNSIREGVGFYILNVLNFFIDFSKIDAEFLEEVADFGRVYKFYFDSYWKLSEKKSAKYLSNKAS